MSSLKTTYKDDVFTGKRKYTEVNNGDGTISFNDVTTYSQVGDTYGAAQINEHNDILNKVDNTAFRTSDGTSTDLADDDYIPFYDASASARKRTLFSNLKAKLNSVFAPKQHYSNSAATYGAATASQFGHVMLSDSYTTNAGAASASKGASSKAVYDAYTTLNNAKAKKNHADTSVNFGKGDASNYGHVRLSDSITDSSSVNSGIAATPKAVRTVYDTISNTISRVINVTVSSHVYTFFFDYKEGKFGWNTQENRQGIFHPFTEGISTGNGSTAGILKLSDSITSSSSTSGGVAATPKAVKTVSDDLSNLQDGVNTCLTSIDGGNLYTFNFTVQNGKYGWKDGDSDTFHPFNEGAGIPYTRFYAKDGIICAASKNRENGIWCKNRGTAKDWDPDGGVSANHVSLNCRFASWHEYKVTTEVAGTLYDFKDHDSSITTQQHMNANQSVTLNDGSYPAGFYFLADDDK